jgi:hypothetical protein
MGEKRLGDIIDDHCIKCRRVTNHSIVSLLDGEAAKVRCRTCYHDHDYRHEQAPPTKKELKRMEADALAAAEAAVGRPSGVDGTLPPEEAPEADGLADVLDDLNPDSEEIAIDSPAEQPAPRRALKSRRA